MRESMPLLRLALAPLAGLMCLAQQSPAPAVEEAVAPVYPDLAVTGRVAGAVTIDVRVSERGEVAAAEVAEGDPLLRQSSLDAARLWRFHGQPGGHAARLVFSFRLMPKNTPEAQLGAVFRPPYRVEVRKITPAPVSHYARNAWEAPAPAGQPEADTRPD